MWYFVFIFLDHLPHCIHVFSLCLSFLRLSTLCVSVCVYVCVFVHACVRDSVYVYVCVCPCAHACMSVCMCLSTRPFVMSCFFFLSSSIETAIETAQLMLSTFPSLSSQLIFNENVIALLHTFVESHTVSACLAVVPLSLFTSPLVIEHASWDYRFKHVT